MDDEIDIGPEKVDSFDFSPGEESATNYQQRRDLKRGLRPVKILLGAFSFIAFAISLVLLAMPSRFTIAGWGTLVVAILLGTLLFTLEKYPLISSIVGIVVLASIWGAEAILFPESIARGWIPKLAALAVLIFAAISGVRYQRLTQVSK